MNQGQSTNNFKINQLTNTGFDKSTLEFQKIMGRLHSVAEDGSEGCSPDDFVGYKWIKTGIYRNSEELNKVASRHNVDGRAREIFDNPALILKQSNEDIGLCFATVKKLTGKKKASIGEIYTAITICWHALSN